MIFKVLLGATRLAGEQFTVKGGPGPGDVGPSKMVGFSYKPGGNSLQSSKQHG